MQGRSRLSYSAKRFIFVVLMTCGSTPLVSVRGMGKCQKRSQHCLVCRNCRVYNREYNIHDTPVQRLVEVIIPILIERATRDSISILSFHHQNRISPTKTDPSDVDYEVSLGRSNLDCFKEQFLELFVSRMRKCSNSLCSLKESITRMPYMFHHRVSLRISERKQMKMCNQELIIKKLKRIQVTYQFRTSVGAWEYVRNLNSMSQMECCLPFHEWCVCAVLEGCAVHDPLAAQCNRN